MHLHVVHEHDMTLWAVGAAQHDTTTTRDHTTMCRGHDKTWHGRACGLCPLSLARVASPYRSLGVLAMAKEVVVVVVTNRMRVRVLGQEAIAAVLCVVCVGVGGWMFAKARTG